jgi:thioredoxin-like negative regulator of GroEL
MAFLDAFKALFAPPAEDAGVPDACLLLESEADLDKAIASRDKLMVLFYAVWCPYSQMFLKTFREHAAAGDPCYARIVVDNGDPVVEKYGISVFPTVLFFERGQLARRLDGTYHRGLSRDQLAEFARRCAVK